MATLTKKDLLEAIEDMPMDAEIYMEIYDYGMRVYKAVEDIEYYKPINRIDLC